MVWRQAELMVRQKGSQIVIEQTRMTDGNSERMGWSNHTGVSVYAVRSVQYSRCTECFGTLKIRFHPY
jgi:hypothetical protein